MAKFQGPTHISSITLSSGTVAVENGTVVAHLLTPGDVTGLKANGFELVPEGAYFALPAEEPEPEPEPAKVEPKASKRPPKTTE